MQAEFELTEREVIEWQFSSRPRRRGNWLTPVYVTGYVAGGIGVMLLLAGFHDGRVGAITLIAIGLFISIYILLGAPGENARRLKTAMAMRNAEKWEIGPDGITRSRSDWTVNYRWRAFSGFRETPNLIILRHRDVDIAAVAKRALPLSEIDEFRRLLHSNISTVRGAFPVKLKEPLT